jgi:hypothetical protein
MERVPPTEPAEPAEPGTAEPPTPDAAMRITRRAGERERQHDEEELDEMLLESFPASDPPSYWAGP